MFRLVKVINGNNQFEAVKLGFADSASFGPGCALICSGGVLSSANGTSLPEYISLSGNDEEGKSKVDAMIVTEDMVFKVEYTGSNTPTQGMSVGLSTYKHKMDAVTYNSSGKGIIVGVDDDKKSVYVRFRK